MSEPPVESADCIHHLFEATVARGPDAPAVRFGARRLTYAQLNRHANRLAHHLRGLGMGPERLAGVLLERSPEALIGILAVLKAGGAFLPLDPAIPPDRLAAILDQARPDLVLTRGELAPRLPPESVAVCVDRDAAAVARQPDANPPAAALPDHLAYVIFTSGSTGAPKGVMVAHRGLCNLAREYVRLFEISPRDRVLQFASLGFDASVEEMFKAWAGGAELHLPEPRAQLPGDDLLQLLRDQAITVATLPPSALAALPAVDLPALRAIAAAGERCSPDLVARWGHGRAFFNAYGPTEATVCATVARCRGASPPS
ncbi:MAG TPA: AMP-binding protein, partial [Myxococcales bacterium]|nr:AMP-binding protein [Myxococcales bacterium]